MFGFGYFLLLHKLPKHSALNRNILLVNSFLWIIWPQMDGSSVPCTGAAVISGFTGLENPGWLHFHALVGVTGRLGSPRTLARLSLFSPCNLGLLSLFMISLFCSYMSFLHGGSGLPKAQKWKLLGIFKS